MKKVLIVLFISFTLVNITLSQSLTEVWKSEPVFATPESVLFDAERDQIYVSNINGQPTVKDGNGFISLIDTNGIIIKLKWVEGLNAPKGMTIKGKKLYVTDIDRIAIIDIEKAEIEKFIEVPGAQFLNDMATGQNGTIYVTDMAKNQLLFVRDEKLDLWLEDDLLLNPNGLAIENGFLLVGCSDYLLGFNPESQQFSYLISEKGGIDGLIPLGNDKYVISDWAGKVQLISKQAPAIVLQNTTSENIQAADLGFVPGRGMIIVPTFFDNRLVAKILNY